MSPQVVMTLWLAFLVAGGYFKVAKRNLETPVAIAQCVGITTRYCIIAAIAWWGGFWG
jgi:hypothetical protein